MHGGLHRPRLQSAAHRAPGFAALDQAGARQHVQVLHDRRQRDLERRRDLGHREFGLIRQTIDDRAPRRVRERREGKIKLVAAKLNHVVKYCTGTLDMSRPITAKAGRGWMVSDLPDLTP